MYDPNHSLASFHNRECCGAWAFRPHWWVGEMIILDIAVDSEDAHEDYWKSLDDGLHEGGLGWYARK